MAPKLFTKRPDTVEAWQWDGGDETAALICDWIIENRGPLAYRHPHEQMIVIDDDVAPVHPNDWIIRDRFNDFFPLPWQTFEAVYRRLIEK